MHLKPPLFTSFLTEVTGILKLAFTISMHIYILLFYMYTYSQTMHTFHKLYINDTLYFLLYFVFYATYFLN